MKCRSCQKEINDEQNEKFEGCCDDNCLEDWEYSGASSVEEMYPITEDDDI
jgi:hypothetical protein